MTNPTRQDIINAHNALKELANYSGRQQDLTSNEEYFRLLDTVSKAFPSKPAPTMADIEWDDDVHFLAEAEDEFGYKVIMIQPNTQDRVACLSRAINPRKFVVEYIKRQCLTPTGRRYTLRSVQTNKESCDLGEDSQDTVRELLDSGLSPINLPEPKLDSDGARVWKEGTVWVEDDESVVYADIPNPSRWTVEEACEIALTLLAAVNYVEENENFF